MRLAGISKLTALLFSAIATISEGQTYIAQDTYLNQGSPDVNYQFSPILRLRNHRSYYRLALLRFDLRDLQGEPISSATLELTHGGSVAGYVAAFEVTSTNWSPDTITYNSSENMYGDYITGDMVEPGTTFSLNLTPYVREGGLVDIALATDLGVNGLDIHSAESAFPPTLTVTTGERINQPPQFLQNPIAAPEARSGRFYATSLNDYINNPDFDPLTYTLTGPAWLQVNDNGFVFGTPANEDLGLNTFTIEAADAETNDVATLEINVIENTPVTFTTNLISKRMASVGYAYSGSLMKDAVDPDDLDLTYALLDGPAWLWITAEGDLNGTPQFTDLGTNTFIVEISDSSSVDTATLEIIVAENATPHFINNPHIEIQATVGKEYLASLAGAVFDQELDPIAFNLQADAPAWLSVSTNGLLTGTPQTNNVGLNHCTLEVVDTAGNHATTPLEITVVDAAQPQLAHTNIVLIYIDDLGWMDLSCQGSEFYETPHIDRLAADGMRFTQGYTAYPRCLPARYSVITGRNPGRDGVPGYGHLNSRTGGNLTLAEALRDGGYATYFAGKWHLAGGVTDDSNMPHNQGFDTNIGGGAAGAPKSYFYPYRDDDRLLQPPHNGLTKDGFYHLGDINDFDNGTRLGEYITDRLTDETITWMRDHQNEPMFIYLSHYAVHGPFDQAPPAGLGFNDEFTALIRKYDTKLASMDYGDMPAEVPSGIGREKMRQDFPTYAAMIEKVDESVGRVIAELDALGLSENTMIVFTSDNGGLSNAGGNNNRNLATSNYPLRTGKGWLYEGGIREAFIVKWPGTAAQGVVNSNDVVVSTDLYPTFLEVAGLEQENTQHVDGISFLPALSGSPFERTAPIIWHSPAARPFNTGDFNGSAIRQGDYKLIDWYDTPNGTELYHIVNDPEERHNLVDELPELAADLLAQVRDWRTSTAGVIVNPVEVSKPPMDYLADPSAPLYGSAGTGGTNMNLTWDNWAGFNYNLHYKTNLLDQAWNLHSSGITATNTTIPINEDRQRFYKLELNLLPR